MRLSVITFWFWISVCSAKGGGGSSSSKGSSPSVGKGSSSGWKGSSGSTATKPSKASPKWSPSRNQGKKYSSQGRSVPVAAGLIGFWLGYQTSQAATEFIDWTQTCTTCVNIRDGVHECSNVDVPFATGRGQVLQIEGGASLDSSCLCGALSQDVFDSCLQCAKSSQLKASVSDIRQTCDQTVISGGVVDRSRTCMLIIAGAFTIPLLFL
jgi:hypothetical protein